MSPADGTLLDADDARAFAQAATALAGAVAFLARQGWTPATSSNFSCRAGRVMAISRSGVDKHAFMPADVMAVDMDGYPIGPDAPRPSAETALHVAVYAERPDVAAVLHTHSVAATVLSMRHAAAGVIVLSDLEILKGLAGVTTHETSVGLGILPNSQDMGWLAGEVRALLRGAPDARGLLIAGHGLYAWGVHLGEARRHVETFEFLLQCRLEMERSWRS